jgi:hypothetical protein
LGEGARPGSGDAFLEFLGMQRGRIGGEPVEQAA